MRKKFPGKNPYQCQPGAFPKYVTEVNLFVEVLGFIENVKVSEWFQESMLLR